MDFLNFRLVSCLPNSSIGRLCENLNNIVGQCVSYDKFQVQNTKWLWLVNDIVTTMNIDKVLCGSFGLYPSHAAGILNSVKEIHFYVFCSEKLNSANYVEKFIAVKSTVLLINHIDKMNSGYHLVLRQLYCRLKQDNFQNCRPI